MAEYIDREVLLKHYIALAKMDWNNKVSPPSWSYAYESFIDYLAELPTADVVPKSEVEELIKSVDDMLDLVCAMTGLELTYYGKYAELKKKYTEE